MQHVIPVISVSVYVQYIRLVITSVKIAVSCWVFYFFYVGSRTWWTAFILCNIDHMKLNRGVLEWDSWGVLDFPLVV